MATGDTLGLNRVFPIYNADGTAFHDLVLKKATYDTVVMSLGDKITGDVYYKDNTLAVTMMEYIEYKQNPDDENEDAVKYVLVNPPTIVREGMASDNGELKGMTKYSFTFYHPMYILADFPFSDVAVTSSQEKYLSQNKTFSWIGTLEDYVAKLNKNLEGTQWVVLINYNSVPLVDVGKLSDVLTFDNQSIADALKTGYETWKVPYVVDTIKDGETHYSEGKRFIVWFGLPTTDIYETDEASTPFVFKFGQGVGLKNNSRTPRNNKIITRIAGYGSEDNIPYGYPQIVWYGNQDWDYTINNDATNPNSYPIYKGIVGGQYVKLIKHPFTRTHLMPSVYVESLFNKVSPYNANGTANANYDPDTELIDYYDAIDDGTEEWDNPIVDDAPSYEIHEFADIKPELTSLQLVSVKTYDDNEKDAISMDAFLDLLNDYYSESENEDEKEALQHLMDAIETEDEDAEWSSGTRTSYQYDWRFTSDDYFKYVTFKSSLLNFENTVLVDDQVTPEPAWDDTMDDDGNYVQSYFKVALPSLGFDLYACAAITQEMSINMRSGACIGCTFPVMVDWDDYKKNFYDEDGNFDPVIGDGHPRDGQKYPNSTSSQITVVLQKETTTFGALMPNIYQQPEQGDKFVILGISLPQSYVTSAESRLDADMIQYMHDNNVYYYDYPLKFDEHFLANHPYILSQMRPNIVVRFEYAGETHALYIKQMTVKYGNKPLPEYNITLTDDVEIVLNQIGQVTQEVSNLRIMLGGSGDGTNTYGDTRYLRKDKDDTAKGLIRFMRGMQVGERFVTGLLGEGGMFRMDNDGRTYLECDRMYVRLKAYFDTVEVRRYIHSGGNRVASAAGIKCSRVEYYTQNGLITTDASEAAYFRCYFRANDNGTEITNDFEINDLAYCKETNIVGEQQPSESTATTRSVSASRSVSEENITISLTITNNTDSPVTLDGDVVFVLGNPDIDGNYHGWEGSYNRTGHLSFSNSAVTLSAGESRTVTVSGDLYRRSPANASAVAAAGRRSNVLLYVGGDSEIAICNSMDNSIVFQNGGTYSVSISQERHGIVQRFYWRKVIGVSSAVTSDGEHYIDLSATDCATGSDVPIAQDDIIQLGNTTDTTRQGAIIEFVTGEDAPSYQIYQGINSYSLEAKNYVRLGYDSESGGAQAFIGNPDGSTYLWYHMVTEGGVTRPQLDIKANVEFSSPDPLYGTENLDDFINAITSDIEGGEDIVTWFGDVAPTLSNYPVNTWQASEYDEHLGDLYYDRTNDHGYKFTKTDVGGVVTYSWVLVDDNGIIEALRAASKAQDTADGKRRVFYNIPTPPYDAGDLWVNATYPANYTGNTDESQHKYRNDHLRATKSVPRTEGGQQITTFSINDWQLATKYTDDALVTDFITNTYAPFVQNIQRQVDNKAQTWYQSQDPSITAPPDGWYGEIDGDINHVGDIWCDTTPTTQNGTHKTFIWKDFGAGASPRYKWAEQYVPQEVFDKIDGKNAIWVSWGAWISGSTNNLQERDLFIPSADTTQGGVTYKANKVYKCTNASTPTFVEIQYTGDETVNEIINKYGNILGVPSPTAENVGEAVGFLWGVLHNINTHIDGGLVLSSLIAMRDTATPPNIWGGISGMYRPNETGTIKPYAYKGHGIAAWYGGAMVDYECLTSTQKNDGWSAHRWARSLFRFDGSGYVANGNLSWDASGNVTLQGYTINATTLQQGGVAVATTSDLSGYLPLSAGNTKPLTDTLYARDIVPNTDNMYDLGAQSLFWRNQYVKKIYLYKPNANNDTNAIYFTIDGSLVKLNGSFYATGGVSALGTNGSGGLSLNAILTSLNSASLAAPSSAVAGSTVVWTGSAWAYSINTTLRAGEIVSSGSFTTANNIVSTAGKAVIGANVVDSNYRLKVTANTVSGTAYGILTTGRVEATGYVVSGLTNPQNYVLLADGNTAAISSVSGSVSIVLGSGTPYDPVQGVITLPAYPSKTSELTNNSGFITSVPVATSDAIGGIKIGYTTSGKKYPVKLSSDKAYVEVPWENDDTKNTAGATNLASTKLFLIGATGQNTNPTTYSNTNCFIGTDNCLYSNGVKVITSHQSLTGYATLADSQTFTGEKTFSGGIIMASSIKPNATEQYGLGASDKRFSSLYVKDANISGTLTVGSFSPSNLSISGKSLLSGGVKAYTLCVECDPNGEVDNQYSGEINRFNNSHLHLQYHSNTGGVTMCIGGGNVAIGTSVDASYKLKVNGATYFGGTAYITSYLYFNSTTSRIYGSTVGNNYFLHLDSTYVQANGVNIGSDMRRKNVVKYVDNLTVNDISLAPIFDFTWKDRDESVVRLGTSAQYWKPILPSSVVEMDDGFLTMDYAAVALTASVITARKVVSHEERIKYLEERVESYEQENMMLRMEIERLKSN